MDIVDQASDHTEQLLQVALANKKKELRQKGVCYNCDEPLPTGAFCDPDCRDDYEKRDRAYSLRPREGL